MYPFGHVPPQPPMAPKGPGWLAKLEVLECLGEDANPYALYEVWDRLVGETWLNQGATLSGRKVSMMLCWEGFTDEWCLAGEDVELVRQEVMRVEAEATRSARFRGRPMAAPPKTAEWLTQNQVANALVLRPSDKNLHDFLGDLGRACWQGTQPTLTNAKLRVALRTARDKQQWCVHRDDVEAFGRALEAAIVDSNTAKPAPEGWVTLRRLAIMTGYAEVALEPRWDQQGPRLYDLNGREDKMLSPTKAYQVALATSARMSVERRYIPIGYLKDEFEADERTPAREFLSELADSGAKAQLGPLSVTYDIATHENRDGRRIPYVHPECVGRFKELVGDRVRRASEMEPEPSPGPNGP